MSKHSPGPWAWSTPDDEFLLDSLVASDGTVVCEFGEQAPYDHRAGTEPGEADARLIAAAPELLAMLRKHVRGNTSPAADKQVRALIAHIDGGK